MSSGIPDFEGRDVAKVAAKITNAGAGLSAALEVDPVALDLGDEMFYVLRGVCTQVNHVTDKDDRVTRVHAIKAKAITEVEAELALRLLHEAGEEVQRKLDERDGQTRLDAQQEALVAEQQALQAEQADVDPEA